MFSVLFFVTEVQNNEKDRKPEEEEQIVIHEDERTSKKSKHVQKNWTGLKNSKSFILVWRLWTILLCPWDDYKILQFK